MSEKTQSSLLYRIAAGWRNEIYGAQRAIEDLAARGHAPGATAEDRRRLLAEAVKEYRRSQFYLRLLQGMATIENSD